MDRHDPRTAKTLMATGLGLGALAVVLLSSRRGRQAIAAVGDKAMGLADRAASASVDVGKDLSQRASELTERVAAANRQARRRVAPSAGEMLQDLADRANVLAWGLVSRARRLTREAKWSSRRRAGDAAARGRDIASDIDTEMEWAARRVPGRAMLLVAAGVGALYAMQRYGVPARVRRSLGGAVQGAGQGLHGTRFVEKSIHIDAPMDVVFDTWSNVENFPRFMRNVERVDKLGGARSHWAVRGPAGVTVEFDSVLTEEERPRKFAWGSEPGSTVQTQGRVSLFPRGRGTLAVVQMSYRPPGGAVGQAVASLFGANPKQELREDLERMKQFIEQHVSGSVELLPRGDRLPQAPAERPSTSSASY